MYRYLMLIVNLWIITATDTPPEENKLLNKTPLLLTDSLGTFHFPKKARITEDQEQEYYYSKKQDGEYFCPIESSTKNKDLRLDIEETKELEFKYCLFRKKFKKKETPMCKKEVKPLLVHKRDKLGQELCGTGRMYKFVYEICVEKSPVTKLWRIALLRKTPKGDIFSDVRHPQLYEVCYDHSDRNQSETSNRTLFTKHKIRSPYIIRNLILYEENRLHSYKPYLTETYGFKALEKLKGNLEAYEKQQDYEKKTIERLKKEAAEQNTPIKIINTFVLEMLVPAGDFALGHWKKATYHMINYSPLHTALVPLWRAINLHVYIRLIELYDEIGDVDIFTGTYLHVTDNKGRTTYIGNDKKADFTIPGIWWKLLHSSDSKKDSDRRGLVIIMHATSDPEPICEEEKKACDPRTWETKFDESYYKHVYCCSVISASKYISTILRTKLKNLEDIGLLELD